MTNPGDINKPNLIDECASDLVDDEWGKYSWVSISQGQRKWARRRTCRVLAILRHRGLLNEMGLEILDRDSGETK